MSETFLESVFVGDCTLSSPVNVMVTSPLCKIIQHLVSSSILNEEWMDGCSINFNCLTCLMDKIYIVVVCSNTRSELDNDIFTN